MKILHLITYAKFLLLYEVIVTGSRGYDVNILGDPYIDYHSWVSDLTLSRSLIKVS